MALSLSDGPESALGEGGVQGHCAVQVMPCVLKQFILLSLREGHCLELRLAQP